ncbi:MAG: carbon-nitrogen family hydrolase [Desulfococcaceae bacterium]
MADSRNHSRSRLPSPSAFGVAGVQFDVRRNGLSENLGVVSEALAELAEKGIRLALLPEMWAGGFDYDRLADHAQETPRVLEQVGELAIRHGMVIGGSCPEADPAGRIFNTLYLIDADGQIAGSYRKVHLFSRTGEDRFFHAGDRPVVCDTALGRIGLMVCYDLRFPELCRTLALMGAELVLVPAQWPDVRIDRWDMLCQVRAMENQLYLLGVNRCGVDGRTTFGGRSILVDPTGAVLDRAEDGPAVISGAVDPERLAAVRERMPCLKERVPAAYRIPGENSKGSGNGRTSGARVSVLAVSENRDMDSPVRLERRS